MIEIHGVKLGGVVRHGLLCLQIALLAHGQCLQGGLQRIACLPFLNGQGLPLMQRAEQQFMPALQAAGGPGMNAAACYEGHQQHGSHADQRGHQQALRLGAGSACMNHGHGLAPDHNRQLDQGQCLAT